MNNELTQINFDYGALDEAQRVRVQVKAESIRARMKRTAEDIIAIGQDLVEVKSMLGHGQFQEWIKVEFDMSYPTANNFMNVASRFGTDDKSLNFRDLSVSVLYLLAAPSTPDAIVEQVQSGEIPPNLDAIKEAKAAQKRAEEAEKQASEQARLAQQQLFAVQSEAQTKIDELAQQIASLQGEMQELTTPKIVEKEVIPEEICQKLQSLQEQVKGLKSIRDVQEEHIQKLNQQVQATVLNREEAENHDRIRQNWRSTVSQTHSALMRLLAQWPTPVDTQSFEADDWAQVDHLKNTLRRVQEECDNLYSRGDDMIIDATPARG